jgi:hypothetical protein
MFAELHYLRTLQFLRRTESKFNKTNTDNDKIRTYILTVHLGLWNFSQTLITTKKIVHLDFVEFFYRLINSN